MTLCHEISKCEITMYFVHSVLSFSTSAPFSCLMLTIEYGYPYYEVHICSNNGFVDNFLLHPQVGEYTLSLKAAHRNKHVRIKDCGESYCIGAQTFDTLDLLIEYYRKHPIYKTEKDKLYLKKAFCPPPESEDDLA